LGEVLQKHLVLRLVATRFDPVGAVPRQDEPT
jgi:hypothetical protein